MSNIFKSDNISQKRKCSPFRRAYSSKSNCIYSWKNLINP